MGPIDYVIFAAYMLAVVGIGYYFYRRNSSAEDYYVGSRAIKSSHVGLSIVATDVGGGFSIGLGGVGFAMGLAGSWLLFTGLVGAWMTAVLVIPRVKALDKAHNMYTYSDFLRSRFNETVALAAALISGIGYLGFTGGQILAGAKLASGTLISGRPLGMDPIQFALIMIAVVTIGYTVLGGLKAVIYTDSFQWVILLGGLALVGVPAALFHLGGWSGLTRALPEAHFSLTNITLVEFLNWMITIIPIWFVAMTLYQRMYACRDKKEAKKAWYIAGLFEYPIMAFIGVILGMSARAFFPTLTPDMGPLMLGYYPAIEAEMGLPMLIKEILPIGVKGLVVAAYFSAIMSTADSCLMASSGNVVNDFIQRHFLPGASQKKLMRLSQLATLIIGVLAVLLASMFQTVLNAILYAYAFMVSGLFIPTLGALFWKRGTSLAALIAMICGGGFSVVALVLGIAMPFGLHVSLYGILISLVVFVFFSLKFPQQEAPALAPSVTGDSHG